MESQQIQIKRVSLSDKKCAKFDDVLAIEEPLEIRVGTKTSHRPLSITMRTPGHDEDLTLGFLFTEGILKNNSQVESISPCGPSGNVMRVELEKSVLLDWEKHSRNFYTTSSCGVCGKKSINALKTVIPFEQIDSIEINSKHIFLLPNVLREAQNIFEETGGLHAAGIFRADGELLFLREDVGRHNALDKVIGHAFKQNLLPLSNHVLMLSGRASFELIQKASMAGVKIIVAIGAPSSLAVELALENQMTLIGFCKETHFNIYSNSHQIDLEGFDYEQ